MRISQGKQGFLIDKKEVWRGVTVPGLYSHEGRWKGRKCGFPAENAGFGLEAAGTVQCVWGVHVPWRGSSCEIPRENRGVFGVRA